MRYRPWGSVSWALSLCKQTPWHFVGVIGTEERSLCSWKHMRNYDAVSSEMFLQIRDVDSDKYRYAISNAMNERRAEYISNGGNISNISSFDLMTELFNITTFASKVEESGSFVVLDITSLPKRFFFPILRYFVKSDKIRNLLLTYTSPDRYADGDLYEDIDLWHTLPGFGGDRSNPELWLVSVGFLVESLSNHIRGNPEDKMKILIPFPAPLAVLQRTWESIAKLEAGYSEGRFEKYRVEALDISAAFDRIVSLAGNPPKTLAFAPFGPKPTSAAMCLYALQRNSSVHYPQPTVYHPNYSMGIKFDDPLSAVNAYWIKHDGEFLYAV